MKDKNWIGPEVEEVRSQPSATYYPAICLKQMRKPTNTVVRIFDVLAQIRNGDHQPSAVGKSFSTVTRNIKTKQQESHLYDWFRITVLTVTSASPQTAFTASVQGEGRHDLGCWQKELINFNIPWLFTLTAVYRNLNPFASTLKKENISR